jgi:hypothetical protein
VKRWLQIQGNRLRYWAIRKLTGGQFYGAGGTIHSGGEVNIERDPATGGVVSVWFRCSVLRFTDDVVDPARAEDMRRMYRGSGRRPPAIRGIVFEEEP